MATQQQKAVMREITTYCSAEHPDASLRPTYAAGTLSVQVCSRDPEDCDCVVDELAARLSLGDAGVTADGRVYAATDHGVAVWTAHEGGVV